MRKNKHYLGFLLFAALFIFTSNCTKSNKSSTPSGTILNTIDIGGNTGILPGLLPGGIAYNDVDNSIWVIASNSSPSSISYVVKLDPKGNFITYTAVGHEATSVVSDKEGNIWISVMNDNLLVELDSEGKIINQFNTGIRPTYIAVDPAGNVWVLNIGPICTGTCNGPPWVATFTEVTTDKNVVSGYSFSTPVVGPFIFDQSGNIWVTNNDADPPIIEMKTDGTIIKTFYGGPSVRFETSFGANMAFDSNGNLWVVNSHNIDGNDNMVTIIYTTVNKQADSYSMWGKYPVSLAVDQHDNIWVSGGMSDTVTKMSNSGNVVGLYRFDQFQELIYYSGPGAIIVDTDNNIWFTDDRQDGYVIELAP